MTVSGSRLGGAVRACVPAVPVPEAAVTGAGAAARRAGTVRATAASRRSVVRGVGISDSSIVYQREAAYESALQTNSRLSYI
ncbi:hypothetical protein Psi01_13790 [Planobispora siamensis]|uniref:Uncharacterized protein n=1 Tax=Planobispora siamensis TaxID=936338 RepID=A0A8J3SCC8_9ACTN|nr:hypothetical protein Psi01_13790 [Planobispora siamensis]